MCKKKTKIEWFGEVAKNAERVGTSTAYAEIKTRQTVCNYAITFHDCFSNCGRPSFLDTVCSLARLPERQTEHLNYIYHCNGIFQITKSFTIVY